MSTIVNIRQNNSTREFKCGSVIFKLILVSFTNITYVGTELTLGGKSLIYKKNGSGASMPSGTQ